MSTQHICCNELTVNTNIRVNDTSNINNLNVKGDVLFEKGFRFKSATKKGFVMTSTANGSAEWKQNAIDTYWKKNKSNDNVYYAKGNVGIGVMNAMESFHVLDNARIDGFIRTGSIRLVDDDAFIMKKRRFAIKSKKDIAFMVTENNNIGINNEFPDERLVVDGNIKLSGNIMNGKNSFCFPLLSDTLIGEKQQQTMYMKTLISPSIDKPTIISPVINGDIVLNNHSTIKGVRQPTESNEVANKEYVDTLVLLNAVVFLKNVNLRVTHRPSNPPEDSRFLISNCIETDWKKRNGHIASWNGLEWIYEIPEQNNVVYLESDGQQLIYTTNTNEWITFSTIVTRHSKLQDLMADDHHLYCNNDGRVGGQVVHGGVSSGDSLVLQSTVSATKGYVLLNPMGGPVGICTETPTEALDVNGNIKFSGSLVGERNKAYKLPNNNQDVTNIVSIDSIDTLVNKTLSNPVLHGLIENFRYGVQTVKKSRTLSNEQVVLVAGTGNITLTLPESAQNTGRKYIIVVTKNNTKCFIKTNESDRINVNVQQIILSTPHEAKTFLSDGIHRWYVL
jgi:hypothetical protein